MNKRPMGFSLELSMLSVVSAAHDNDVWGAGPGRRFPCHCQSVWHGLLGAEPSGTEAIRRVLPEATRGTHNSIQRTTSEALWLLLRGIAEPKDRLKFCFFTN